MKICLVSSLPPLYSGVSLYTLGLVGGFDRVKSSFSLVVIANKSSLANSNSQQVKIQKVWNRGPKYFFQVLAALVREKPDVVHFQHEFFLYGGFLSATLFPALLLFGRILGIKVIVTMHGVVPRKLASVKFAEAFFLTKNLLLLQAALVTLTDLVCMVADVVIVHSKFARETLRSDYKIPLKKIKVVPHGVGFAYSTDPKESVLKMILFFGNITPSKGLETLVAAFEKIQVPNTKLVIAGSAHPRGKKYFEDIVKIVKSSKASQDILLTGYVADNEIHSLFQECNLAVFPYTFAVSSSGGLSFALQHLKPTIVSALPTFLETIVDGKTGLVVPVKDSKALADAIERLLLNSELRKSIKRGLREACSNLMWPVIADKTLICYQES